MIKFPEFTAAHLTVEAKRGLRELKLADGVTEATVVRRLIDEGLARRFERDAVSNGTQASGSERRHAPLHTIP